MGGIFIDVGGRPAQRGQLLEPGGREVDRGGGPPPLQPQAATRGDRFVRQPYPRIFVFFPPRYVQISSM